MANCPNCGSEMGPGIAFCPICGEQIEGEVSQSAHTEGPGPAQDPAGDGMGASGDHPGGGGGASTGRDAVQGPDAATSPEEVEGPSGLEQWVADDDELTTDIEADATVPGSEVPPSRGGGWDHREEPDDEGPSEITHAKRLDRPATDLPRMPDPDLGLDGHGRAPRPGRVPWVSLVTVVLLVVIIALGAWYIWGYDGDDNGDDGNGNDPYEGLHILRDGTWGFYPYEPPGEYNVTVALRNNGSSPVNLDDYEVKITVWKDQVDKGSTVEPLSGTIGAGGTRTFDVVVDTEVLGGGDQLVVAVTLRVADGGKRVHTIDLESTV